jgi:hypothetical protein
MRSACARCATYWVGVTRLVMIVGSGFAGDSAPSTVRRRGSTLPARARGRMSELSVAIVNISTKPSFMVPRP